MARQIALDEIRIDGGTQMRQQIDYQTAGDYAEAFKAGADFPAVKVFHDGKDNWLADGFHRWHGAKQAGVERLKCDVEQGSLRDAILYAVGANDTNGKRRSLPDKRVAVMALLHDKEWSKRSDKWIAETARVSRPMVAEWRSQCGPVSGCSSASCKDDEPRKVEGKDGKTYTVKKSKPKTADLHVPPIDADEPKAPKVSAPAKSPAAKTFDNERNLVRGLADLVALIKQTRYEADFDKGRLAHDLNTWANDISDAMEAAEAVV